MKDLPIARLRFTIRQQDALVLPEYAGSLLRGVFGAALRRTACMTHLSDCTGCSLRRTCPYPAIFDNPAPDQHSLQRFSNVPNPYVIEPPAWGRRELNEGQDWSFHMVVIGHALRQLPLIVYAWQRAFGAGIRHDRAKGELVAVDQVGHDGHTHPLLEQGRLFDPMPLELPEVHAKNTITLVFDTPLRLQHQGHALPPDKLDPRTLFTALMRRASLLLEFHAGYTPTADYGKLASVAANLQDWRMLEWRDWTRYSGRQQQTMALGGVIGRWTLSGELAPLLPWLRLGEWIHVGKNATMGLGRYRIEVPCSGDNLKTMPNHCEHHAQIIDFKQDLTSPQ